MSDAPYTSEQLLAAAIAAYTGVTNTASTAPGEVREVSVDLAIDALLYAAAIVTEGTAVAPIRTPKDIREMSELVATRFKRFLTEMKAMREADGKPMLARLGATTDPADLVDRLTKQ